MDKPSVAVSSDTSFSPPRRQPTGLTIRSFFPFGTQPPAASPIRRKPLPPGARTPVSPTQKPPPTNTSLSVAVNPQSSVTSPQLMVRDLDEYPRGQTPLVPTGPGLFPSINSSNPYTAEPEQTQDETRLQLKSAVDLAPVPDPKQSVDHRRSKSMAVGVRTGQPARPELLTRSVTMNSMDQKGPKTPGNKITNFFGWKNTSPGAESSSTDISDSLSNYPSPIAPSPQTSTYSMRAIPPAIDINKANAMNMEGLSTPGLLGPAPLTESDLTTKLSLLEAELREISAELASSIRREMELEDMVENLQSDNPQATGLNHRTSDYFSDSSSSVRDVATKIEDLEKIRRQSEQERAQLKVTLSQKWQDERSKRKALESHVQLLEEQLSHSRRDKADISTISTKAKELESSLDDARRKLAEERQIKDNFEDLLTALRVELEQHRNERDNLRDEVVPQLQAQLKGGFEGSFDYIRMQQQIQQLRSENSTLMNARKLQMEMQQQQIRFNTIAEEGGAGQGSLSRSGSLAKPPRNGGAGGLVRSGSVTRGSLTRSDSISGLNREALLERMKDVELQRDALHSAVKSLLDRQAHQTREHEKIVKMLQVERDRALDNSSPRRQGYEKEVGVLREEINQLRKRADEALLQKWQCEKGLGGLKMDLDRAKQETTSLRDLLEEHDISIPEELSSSLQESYSQLLKDMKQAESRKDSFRSLEEEQRLADQLRSSTERSEALAAQVRQQLYTNKGLRDRLGQAINRGEQNQKTSASKIIELQSKLKKLEDTITAAQQSSETAMMRHEEEVRTIKDSHNAQLLRVKSGLRTPTTFAPKSPLSPMFSPRLGQTTSGLGIPLNQALKTEWLESKVKELEKALGDADKEMEEVVGRMNMAQIEVAELQGERDEALRRTRKLQAEILAEREKVKALMSSN